MAAPIGGSLLVQGRFPLDDKYWVNSITNLEDGQVYDGLHRWTKDLQIEYVRRFGVWEEAKGDSVDTEYIDNEIALLKQVIVLVSNNKSTYYTSINQAESAAKAGDTIYVRGYYPGTTSISKAVSIVAYGAIFDVIRIGLGTVGSTYTLIGGTYLVELGVHKATSQDNHLYYIENVSVPTGGLIDIYGLRANSQGLTKVYVTNSRIAYVRNQQRDDLAQPMGVYFRDCILGAGNTDVIGGYAHKDSLITTHNCTFIVPKDKQLVNIVGISTLLNLPIRIALTGISDKQLPNYQANSIPNGLVISDYADPWFTGTIPTPSIETIEILDVQGDDGLMINQVTAE